MKSLMVDPRRLELLTSSMPWKRSSQLNYGPVKRGEIYPKRFRNQADFRLVRFSEHSPALGHVLFDTFEHDFVDASALGGDCQAGVFVEHDAPGRFYRADGRRSWASGQKGVFSKKVAFREDGEHLAFDRYFHPPFDDDVGFGHAIVVFLYDDVAGRKIQKVRGR